MSQLYRLRALGCALGTMVLVVGACGATPSASERVLVATAPTPTSVPLPFPAPTSSVRSDAVPTTAPIVVPSAESGEESTPTPAAIPTSTTPPVEPTATSEPTATATAEPTAVPEPTTAQATATAEPTTTPDGTPTPTETPTPDPNATPSPTPTSTPNAIDGVTVSCEIDSLSVRVDELVTVQASQEPAERFMRFLFNLGNGETRQNNPSFAQFPAPGDYVVSVQWTSGQNQGIVRCGTVEVVGVGSGPFEPKEFLALSEAEATVLASERAYEMRIVRRDAVEFPGTADFRMDRINFEIDAGLVTAAWLG